MGLKDVGLISRLRVVTSSFQLNVSNDEPKFKVMLALGIK